MSSVDVVLVYDPAVGSLDGFDWLMEVVLLCLMLDDVEKGGKWEKIFPLSRLSLSPLSALVADVGTGYRTSQQQNDCTH